MAEYHTMTTNSRTHYCTSRRGFTLAEAMMAVVVLGIAAASVLLPFVSGMSVRTEGINRTLAARLAGDLMEEILRLPFHDPDDETSYSAGPDAGDLDNIDDYHGYIEAQGQVKDAAGFVFTDSNYANFSRSVVCEYVRVPGESVLAPLKFIRVTVQMYYDGKQIATIHRLVGK